MVTRRHAVSRTLITLICCTASARADPSKTVGKVVNSAGEPVQGAEVVAATPQLAAWPNLAPEERDGAMHSSVTATTDKAGRFTITLPERTGALAVAHPKFGYARVRPDALGEAAEPIKLAPWGKIEGTVKVGARPAPAGTKVSLGVFYVQSGASAVHYGYDTVTDAQGRYSLGNVPAGLNQVKVKLSATGSPLEQYVGVESGKTVRFDIGGHGRPVVGKLVLHEADLKDLTSPDPKSRRLVSNCHFRRDAPWPKPPYVNEGQSAEEREEILSNWRRTPEAVEQWKEQFRYNVEFQPDGTFRFDDVPPGKYWLTLTLYDRTGGQGVIMNQRTEVTVPETPAVPTDEPLDLGEQKFETKGADTDGL